VCVLNTVTNTYSAILLKISTQRQLYFAKTTLIVSAKNLTAVSDGRLMVAHAHILLPIELHTKILLLYDAGNSDVNKTVVKNKTKTKTLLFVLEAPRDQDFGLEDYITDGEAMFQIW